MESTLDAFKAHIDSNLQEGTDGEGELQHFVPSNVLDDYWGKNLRALLLEQLGDAGLVLDLKIKKLKRHLRLISTLAFISTPNNGFFQGLGRLINNDIDDIQLPMLKQRHEFEQDTWEQFERHQWKFCPIPLTFEQCFDEQLDSRSIFQGVEIDQRGGTNKSNMPGAGAHSSSCKFFRVTKDGTAGRHKIGMVRLHLPLSPAS